MQLTWLKIHKFRNVKPGTELHFGPKFNVLLGKNASGKTTLLDLLSAISDDVISKYEGDVGDGTDLEYRYSGFQHHFQVRTSCVSRTSALPLTLPQGLGIAEPAAKHRLLSLKVFDDAQEQVLACEIDGNRGKATMLGVSEFALDVNTAESSGLSTAQALFACFEQCGSDDRKTVITPLMLHRWLTVYNFALRFDEALRAYQTMSFGRLTLQKKAVKTVFMPLGVANSLRERLEQDPEGYAKDFSFLEVPELARVLSLLSFAQGAFRPQLAKRTSNNGDSVYEFKDIDFVMTRASGDVIRADLLSFGQKRLLSFFWYLAVRGELPVIADELANGLHHEWIEACVEELSKRQSFLATQNPLLLDYVPAGTPDTTLIHCSTEVIDGHETLCWRNFTDEEQARLDSACEVGIQHVSEILRSEGLW